MNTQMTNGAHHIGLTVPELAQSERFFVDTLGYKNVGGKPDYPAVFLHDGATMVTLWQARNPENAGVFDRHNNIGLHHLALKLADGFSLDQMYAKLLRDPHVDVEFAPEALGDGPTQHLMCLIPGGIRVEFIATAT